MNKTADSASEKFIVVDDKDNVIGYKSKAAIDKEDLRYRVSALWVRNSKGDILLARRAYTKSHDPGKWGPAVAGTVEKGESYVDNIRKEAMEEIGLTDMKLEKGPKTKRYENHKYFTQWYTCIVNKPATEFVIQKDEVAEVRWFSKRELERQLKENTTDFLKGMGEWLAVFN